MSNSMGDDDPRDPLAGDVEAMQFLRGALAMLQVEPQRYKLFGVYWWAIKALLRRAGYTTANCYLLGDYQDAETAEMIPAMNLADTIRAAVTEFQQNATFPHKDGQVENEDGELVTIWDEDARF